LFLLGALRVLVVSKGILGALLNMSATEGMLGTSQETLEVHIGTAGDMIERIAELTTEGESITVEFKRARDTLPASVYETICAFLNRDG
jgi:hypothetical protein